MRKLDFVPRIILALALLMTAGCAGRDTPTPAEATRNLYQRMEGCTAEAVVSCTQWGEPWTAELRCEYIPEGSCRVEVLSPARIAGTVVTLDEENGWYPAFEGGNLDAGAVSVENVSPASCLPRLFHALREGWLLEENRETWNGVPCIRLLLDESGETVETLYFTLWLREEDGAPVRGEIAVDGETVLTADVTAFSFTPKPSE